ncbi:MAG: hypothetical protein ACREAC_25205, partial [Blastocatellia bacterium]
NSPLGLGMPESSDYTTVVKVKATRATVQEVLSNFIPLKDRPRVIWVAQTRLGPDAITYVRYP